MNAITTTALVATLLSVLALAVQRQELGRLDDQESELQGEVRVLKGESSSAGSASIRSDATKRSGSPGRRSEPTERVVIEELVERIQAFLKSKNIRPDPQAMVAILPDLLKLVEECTGPDLAVLSKQLGDPEKMGPGGSVGDMVAMILRVISIEHDPESYVTSVDEKALNGPEREMWTAGISSWARQDPEGALAWLEEDKARQHPAGYMAVCTQLQKRDVGRTAEVLASLDREIRDRALQALLSAAPEKGAEYAQHAQSLEDEEARRRIMGAGIGAVMLGEGLEAGAKILQGIGDETDRAHATSVAATVAADAQPKETLDWLLTLPMENEVYRSAVGKSLRVWVFKDFEAAAGWLGELQPSPVKDEALKEFSSSVLVTDPRAAVLWAGEIEDPSIRASAMERNLAFWKRKDPEAAQAWEDSQKENE